ncbi:hypothetical protein [Vineibacter terrae]|nr:hypothetical protein [Vineibacter terrae]
MNVVNFLRQKPQLLSPLVTYALNGLEKCWMPGHGRWSHIYHLDGRTRPNESVPHSDAFYTLNVLLGMSRLPEWPAGIVAAEIYAQNAVDLLRLPATKYAYGMALWSAAELGLDVPQAVAQRVESLLSKADNWHGFRAQDLGMLLAGVIAQARAGDRRWVPFIDPLFAFLREHYHAPSGLFFDQPHGFRRRFASFATQTYLTLACYLYGEFTGKPDAIAMADGSTRKLIALQGPQGEWPWFFDAQRGTVLDYYEVYSVHQYGMAPAFLEHAEQHGVKEARDALIRGFKWVLGENQLRRPMLVPDLQLSIRSQVRKGELRTAKLRMLRALANAHLNRQAGLIDPAGLDVRLECRSYELGWILWSFGRRTDLKQLTHDPAFAAPAVDELRRAP